MQAHRLGPDGTGGGNYSANKEDYVLRSKRGFPGPTEKKEELEHEEEITLELANACWSLLREKSKSDDVEYLRAKLNDEHDFVGGLQLAEVRARCGGWWARRAAGGWCGVVWCGVVGW